MSCGRFEGDSPRVEGATESGGIALVDGIVGGEIMIPGKISTGAHIY